MISVIVRLSFHSCSISCPCPVGCQANPISGELSGLPSLPSFNQVKTFTHYEPLTGSLNRDCPATPDIDDCCV